MLYRVVYFYTERLVLGMPYKDATVTAHIDPEDKRQAEEILDELGVSVSLLVKTLYRQIILTRRVPFSMELPES